MHTLEAAVRAVNWSAYQTAYGPADRVGDLLIALASPDEERALKAGLCHQHAYDSSAALPAAPFIIEVLREASPRLTVEILDILFGFAACTNPPAAYPEHWKRQLHAQLVQELPLFRKFVDHENDDVRYFARSTIELLGATGWSGWW